MSDKMTAEQRERLRQWQQGELGNTISANEAVYGRAEGPVSIDGEALLDHLNAELRLLVEVNTDLLQAQGLLYYAQAIADLEYFLSTGTSLRKQPVQERARRGHDVLLRASIPLE